MSSSRIFEAYAAKTPGSARLYQRALENFPNGVTHIGRHLRPHPLFVDRANGPCKWDVDGNEYVDYFGGHGALLLGHNHPAVTEAVVRQAPRGVHYGASHELEVEWAEAIRSMIPSAGRVRFTTSGTEATHLALRLARAHTGKPKVIRFLGHFHGWHDHVAFGADVPAGILPGVAEGMLLCRPNDIEQVRELCATRGDIAAIILEPTGATFGQIPCPPEFLRQLREVTLEHGILLIFDEVITGFRVSPGGAQAHYGVTPDMTTLAKIIAGGYPGAAVVGRPEVFEPMSGSPPRVAHQGTYNSGPVSAAAGIATLRVVRQTRITQRANDTGAAIRDGINDVCQRRGIPWCAYGEFSGFHIFTNPGRQPVGPADIYAGKVPFTVLKGGTRQDLVHRIRAGFLAAGVDLTGWPGGVVSGMHGAAHVDRTVTAFEALVGMLEEEGEFQP
ncbi:MAG: aspartate aminotransferase family protein [Acidobacteria bacterium]|nr:aspartate aminotransferase family protein [Acidobacteriota bacterium]